MTGNELHSNTAKGDIAGGDIHKNTYVQAKDKSPLRKVVEKLEADCLHDPDFNKYINALTHYTNSVHPDSQRDLQTKLTEANRQDELHEAEELKEKFAKLLVKSSLSEQAQNAYVHVLSKIKLDYDHKVKPLLKEGAGLTVVEASVHEIIMGIYEDLDLCAILALYSWITLKIVAWKQIVFNNSTEILLNTAKLVIRYIRLYSRLVPKLLHLT